MSESNFEKVISEIIFDSPAGEIKQVYDSLITIVGENSKDTLLNVIEQYNIKNNIPIDVDGNNILLSENNKDGASRYFDPINGVSFTVDHMNRKGLDVEPYQAKGFTDNQKSLYQSILDYTTNAYPGDVTIAVYPIIEGDTEEAIKLEIIISSTKYNPDNFWNGDWRSKYVYDKNLSQLTGTIDVQIHYYEDGNVSFKSNKTIEQNNVKDIAATISDIEKEFENSLDVSFTELNEKQFKSLRRRLPITRSKINWGKAIGNYRLGKDAAEGA
ncbi:similar to Saccharomyces cerevisiae YKL007W CAP1 Alpha subunit of the capping protein (CP) heterodimer (Cap1p and Cap2p) which binds to the barbed ends of actin filaments preventing further polymerization [Maudiozyma barnettii]|uniref:F-actin-capping protein subunit alpha n=1 Tax=Maudiozyma barnettii TaxID=61262 RepID=A0A8H2VKL0_9SACH|nr:Cap1p [Kazachstania barnettii]CAB4257166.1 similar to Saccharomyces cerevisiae YKL007W CAP1 Alpha subunit of the capping protein (CP) heterodimer (Cap1p and Cap2p) which binds to the barbed ends of actin filaments preventing further polymerization [Kazachstania barnettii]CAD1779536.1 similar to Saccharomyces cerevisiae YKL007W CAP1 Alpha subunit of the capping protein (CP) heterodimer (Cap1p and Cap2p) which binds to the barbed ends of actin filaments preventing further polymerization [Kazachs